MIDGEIDIKWNIVVSATPVQEQRAGPFGLAKQQPAQGGVGGGARGGQATSQTTVQPQTPSPAQQQSRAQAAPRQDSDSAAKAKDEKKTESTSKRREEAVDELTLDDSAKAKKPSSQFASYNREVAKILTARFNRILAPAYKSGNGVTIRLVVSSDGKITSLKDGHLQDSDIVRRSSTEAVNQAAAAAIAEGGLPAFTGNEKQFSSLVLTIKFDPATK